MHKQLPRALCGGQPRASWTAHDYPEALRLLAQGQVRVEPLITHRFPLREAHAAFALALQRERAVKVLLLG
ncbi:MAG: hypothetical protein NZ849_10735 [Meiothermus sp.]|uniref:hypothetical protein n=1 Tax=Meiothermus sp. TaxID=1955249 RepID=UPI0025D12A66|nr:hypothetical protein [Meiothermus sp.]MCS7195366.1 hypothetical protein [Meiothermus sp.]